MEWNWYITIGGIDTYRKWLYILRERERVLKDFDSYERVSNIAYRKNNNTWNEIDIW